MKTTVAISSRNKKTISKHAEKCQNYFIYTIDNHQVTSKNIIELKDNEILDYTFHEDKSKSPKNLLFDVDVLLTRGICPKGIDRLAKHNVTAYIIEETDPDFAIEKLIKGTLEAMAPVSYHKTC